MMLSPMDRLWSALWKPTATPSLPPGFSCGGSATKLSFGTTMSSGLISSVV